MGVRAPPLYGRPPYRATGGHPPSYPYGQTSPPTHTLAIVAPVPTSVCVLAGLGTGVIARRWLRESGGAGDGRAVVVSSIFVGPAVACTALVAVLVVTTGRDTTS